MIHSSILYSDPQEHSPVFSNPSFQTKKRSVGADMLLFQ